MAFNWQTFRTRTLTAVVFVVVMLMGLLWNYWSFFVLFSIIHFGCWWEYLQLTEKIHQKVFNIYLKIGLMLLGYGLLLWFPWLRYYFHYELKEYLLLLIPIAGFILLLVGHSRTSGLKQDTLLFALLGIPYISLSLALMISLVGAGTSISCMNGGTIAGADTVYNHFVFPFVIVPLTIIASLWINDTMAYLVGSIVGKTPLSKISPRKTWEGTLGGIVLSVFVTGLIFSNLNPEIVLRRFHYDFPNYVWYVIAAIASITGTFGDLLESKLKRMANVKDSGTLMPGHGGFLDRFDSLLLAIPPVWLFLYFFKP